MSDSDLATLRQELHLLNERSQSMTEEMSSLAGALISVNQLQERQRDIERAARTASTRVEEVAARSATKDDIDELNRQRRRAVRNLYIAVSTGTVAVLMVGIGGIAAATAYTDSQHRFLQIQYNNCMTRNKITAGSRALTGQLIEAEQHSLDPVTAAKLITALRQAENHQGQVDCSTLLKD